MYMPVLNKKAGEMAALSHTSKSVVANVIPLIMIHDVDKDDIKKIQSKFSGHFIIDARFLDSDEISVLEDVLKESNINADIAYPSSVLTDPDFRSTVKYLRLSIETLIDTFFVQWASENVSLFPEQVILDAGFVDSDNLLSLSNVIQSTIRLMDNSPVTTFYVVSGAVPTPLNVKSTEDFVTARYDLKLYQSVKSNISTSVKLIFGDYTIVSPKPINYPQFITPIVQIKYTSSSEYFFVRNGQFRGKYTLLPVCQKIANLNGFNSEHCWGDLFIHEVVEKGLRSKGNPTTWVTVGVSHHIALCAEEQS
ncbi:beta family protein [Lacticaseibacillus chiayiensis]|uniref:beta family protein n=1 Tax=Lacticaseibacillus chiayiensis TaxID=2100821 RepID=UPI003C72DF8D